MGRPPARILRVNAPALTEGLVDDEADPEGEEAAPIKSAREIDAEKLSEFMEQFGELEYKVRVERMNVADKAWEYMETFPISGFDAFGVCKGFGPGRYRMTFINEKGRYVAGGQPQIRIGAVLGPSVVSGSAPAVSDDPLKSPIVALLLANAESQRKESSELLRAILTRPEPARSSTNEVLDLMVKLNAMNPREKDDSMKKLSETLMLRMIERGMDQDGGSGEGGGILSDIKDALPILKEMLAAKGPRPGGAAAPGVTNGPVRVTLPNDPSKPQPQEPDPMTPLLQGLKPYVAIFKTKAENGIDQDRAAQYLIDELYDSVIPLIKKHVTLAKMASDEAILESLVTKAKDPAQVADLFKFAPELDAHRDWVTSVIGKAITALESPDEDSANG